MSLSVFDEIVQLRNPAELLPPNGAGDVASRVYFCSVDREGTKVAVVVKAPSDSDCFQHGTVARVVGAAYKDIDTLRVDATTITAVEGARSGVEDAALAPPKPLDGVPVIGGPLTMTLKEKNDAFKVDFPNLMLVDVVVKRAKRAVASVVVRARIVSGPAAVVGKGPITTPVMMHFRGTLAEVSHECMVVEVSEVRCVWPSTELVDKNRNGWGVVARSARVVFNSVRRILCYDSAARVRSGAGRMEIYPTGVFFSEYD